MFMKIGMTLVGSLTLVVLNGVYYKENRRGGYGFSSHNSCFEFVGHSD